MRVGQDFLLDGLLIKLFRDHQICQQTSKNIRTKERKKKLTRSLIFSDFSFLLANCFLMVSSDLIFVLCFYFLSFMFFVYENFIAWYIVFFIEKEWFVSSYLNADL